MLGENERRPKGPIWKAKLSEPLLHRPQSFATTVFRVIV